MSRVETEAMGERPARTIGPLAWIAERVVPEIALGQLTIRLPGGATIRRTGARPGPSAEMAVHRTRALVRIVASGEMGFADGYLDGDWSTPDLAALLSLLLENEDAVAGRARGGILTVLRDRLAHRLHANTRRGSRRNIAAHYDLGNDFYALWLDRGMNYSSALFTSSEDLETAQVAKLDRIADLLAPGGTDRLLEIGCGWGALAERLAARVGSYAGVTLSTEQRAYAASRLAAMGARNAEIRLQDYRDVTGRFDRIASIEMFEAVGERYWPVYFDKLRDLLVPAGVAVMQVITIAESRFAAYRRRPDFIQRHVFPGGMLPTLGRLREEAARVGFAVEHVETMGASYARTLQDWRRRFTEAWPRVQALGFDDRFFRLWTYYLAYCEAGFAAGSVDVCLLRLKRGA